MIVVPYEPKHLESLLAQPSQVYMRKFMSNAEYQKSLAIPGESFAAIDGEMVLACAGLVKYWDGRAAAWSILGSDLRKNFLQIHYATKRFLDACNYHRVEAHVDSNFGCGRRWMELLGFNYEGVASKFTPDARDCLLFARIK